MNSKTKYIPDSNVDKILKKTTWMTFDELLIQRFNRNNGQLTKLVWQDEELLILNEYRSALGTYAKITNDTKQKVIVTLDWRDTAGKWSNIKRVTEYFDLKRYKVNAYWIPDFEERFEYNWFKRYMDDFPRKWQVAFFDRSWNNRAWVEAAMWFCTEDEYNWYMENVNDFEKEQIIDKWIKFIKIYLSITKDTQKYRLKNRDTALKDWKSSFVDKAAQEKWNYYTLAKAKILELTDTEYAPWTVLDSNARWESAIEIIKAIIKTSDEATEIIGKEVDLSPNKSIVRNAEEELIRMEEEWVFKKMKQLFHFKNLSREEQIELELLRDTLVFDEENYRYVKK